MDIDTGTTTVPFVRYRCSSLAHHLLVESNWHRAPLSNVYFKCGGYFREEKCGVSKKCGAE